MNTKALKQKILDLAIHGKLLPLEKVEQIRKEEPASKLLEKIRTEKQEKIAKGEQKKDKNDSFIFVGDDKRHYEKFTDGTIKDMEDEIPFDVPDGWSWCRLGEICNFIGGGTPDKTNQNYWNGNIHWASVKDIKGDNLFSTEDKITELGLKESSANLAKIDDIILITRISPGKAIITKIETAINQDLKIVIPIIELEKYFLLYFFQTNESDFIENSSGTTVKGIKLEYLLSKFIPLPPLAEQKLIVEEIEKIFAQIDQLEQNKTDLQTAIKQAKSKILDLAIHGKLVPQDPNEEPASVLLEKIHAEKEAKIAKGELKRDKNDSYIYKGSDNCHYEKFADETEEEIEVPFELPNGWCWGKLKDSGIVTDTGYPFNASNFTTDPKNRKQIIRIRDILRGYSETYSDEQCPTSYIVNKGDILVGMDGDFNVGKWKTEVALLNQRVCRIKKEYNAIILDYVFYLLPIPLLEINKNTSSVTVKHLSNKQIENLIFPIPPLNEQTRIVSKIEELFSILDNISLNLV